MNSVEKKYYACESEAVGVILALNKFRVYLMSSKPFVVVTEHMALKYAFQKKYIHGRLARWLDFLAESKFEVSYRPGKQNATAYFLSRPFHADGPFKDGDDADVVCAIPEEALGGNIEDLEDNLQEIYRKLSGIHVELGNAPERA